MAAIELSTKDANHVSIVHGDDNSVVLSAQEWAELDEAAKVGFTPHDQRDMQRMGKKQEFRVRYTKTVAVICLTANRGTSRS